MFGRNKECCPELKSVVFKDGMSIDMTKGAMAMSFKCYIISSVLTIVIVSYSLVTKLFFFPLFLIIHWIMCCCSQATHYIWNNKSLDETYDN